MSTLEIKLEQLKEMYSKLVNSDVMKWNEIKCLDKTCGVYFVFFGDVTKKPIYIGSTGNFKVRFGTDLRHYSTHTLIRKLKKRYNFSDNEAFRYVSEKCVFRIIVCDSKREAEAVEHFAIWVLDPVFNK